MLSGLFILIISFSIFLSILLLNNTNLIIKLNLSQYRNNNYQQTTDIHQMNYNVVKPEYIIHKIYPYNHLKQIENEHKRSNKVWY
jgi:hypothetical protein